MYFRSFLLFVALSVLHFSCTHFESDEALARRTCGGCHLAPDPEMLDKTTWEQMILPRMGAWLGVSSPDILLDDMQGNSSFGSADLRNLIPDEPAISMDNWVRIQNYYINNAPDKMEAVSEPTVYGSLDSLFDFEQIKLDASTRAATNTLVHFDAGKNKIYVGRRAGRLMVYDPQFQKLDSLNFDSSPSAILSDEDQLKVLLTGEIRPNNEAIGTLKEVDFALNNPKTLIQGLFRPVSVAEDDLDGDGRKDYVISNFGFHIGKLAWYRNTGTGQYEEQLLMPLAGAVQVEIDDIDGDGKKDIIAMFSQGNESVFAFRNLGKGEFKPEQWIQLPPVYGSTAFGWKDFDGDGFKDIVIANGDNADYSQVPKPYHGVRFFKNDGRQHFTEERFFPLKGASGVELADFDGDGDVDVAVIANFAAFSDRPQRGFVLYLNQGGFNFSPLLSPRTDCGRYLVFEHGDIDNDGDQDLILGSHMVPLMVNREEIQKWLDQRVDLLILRNKTR